MNRRHFLAASAALGAAFALPGRAQAKPLAYADMHSHVGAAKRNLHDEMVRNRVLLIARTLSADRPVTRNEPRVGIRQVREPQPGELAAAFDQGIQRIRDENVKRRLVEVTDAATLQRMVAAGNEPAVVLAAEGGDFLDGDLKRLEAARAQGIVHVQLVHYRVSEVGDICTEMPVHGGLTPFGKDVVRTCNRLGILVDIAHCTHEGMAQALEISTKPIVYSHGHVISSAPYWTNGVNRARAISTAMARRVAERGGVIGIWTPVSQYRTLDSYAAALVDTASLLGAAHVGVGSDMAGIPGGSLVPGYDEFGLLGELLAKRGASAPDIAAILGGNYLRVLAQALTP